MVGNSFTPGVRACISSAFAALRPSEKVFTATLHGWCNQQLSRNLVFSKIKDHEKAERALTVHAAAGT